MVWQCPPLHLPNWNNLWKWKTEMNNEPVAWMETKNGKPKALAWVKEALIDAIPLYIHPVNPKYDPETGEPLIDGYPLFSGLPHPVKELTDEEFDKIFADGKRLGILETEDRFYKAMQLTDEEIQEIIDNWNFGLDIAPKEHMFLLCRAILRKAQEK